MTNFNSICNERLIYFWTDKISYKWKKKSSWAKTKMLLRLDPICDLIDFYLSYKTLLSALKWLSELNYKMFGIGKY